MLDAAERMTDSEWDAMVAHADRIIEYHNSVVADLVTQAITDRVGMVKGGRDRETWGWPLDWRYVGWSEEGGKQ